MKTLLTSLIMALLISLLAVGAFAQTDDNPASEPGGDPVADPVTNRSDAGPAVGNDPETPTYERNGPPEGDDPGPIPDSTDILTDGIDEVLKAFDEAAGILTGDMQTHVYGPGFASDLTHLGPPVFADGIVGFGAASDQNVDNGGSAVSVRNGRR